MAFLKGKEIDDAYTEADDEAKIWKEDYHEFERLMANGLLDDLDETLPEVNDGSLAASLFKLPKRIVSDQLNGRVKALDVDDSWIAELANIEWSEVIIPNSNSQAPFIRKWKHAVRMAAGYGGIPIVDLFVHRGNYEGADFIVAQAGDVKLEAGKTSDYDSDILFWDLYMNKLSLLNLIEQAQQEIADHKAEMVDYKQRKAEYDDMRTDDEALAEWDEEPPQPYNRWWVKGLQDVYKNHIEEDAPSNQENKERLDKGVKRGGYHFYIAFQRGVTSPFELRHRSFPNKPMRAWSNPDPTGDVPVHYLYCYQDLVNPYGVGIVKLAGGTQNVLDYMRQADVKSTQLGINPPIKIKGAIDDVDEDSLTFDQYAHWIVGDSDVEPVEIANSVYEQLPARINMYQSSLNKLIPLGDSTVSSGSGDPLQSKTPAGVKQATASLSIDDDDFRDNLYITFGAVAKSMINTHFANMQGNDLRKLSDEQRDILIKAGLKFPVDPVTNQPTNQLDIIWDEVRATFDFEVEADQDEATETQEKIGGLLNVAKLRSSDPSFDDDLRKSGKKINMGELYSDVISLSTKNNKIIEDISPQDEEQYKEQQAQSQQEQEKTASESIPFKDVAAVAPNAAASMLEQNGLPGDELRAMQPGEAAAVADPNQQAQPGQPQPAAASAGAQQDPNVAAIVQHYGVDENIAQAMLAAEQAGYDPKEIVAAAAKHQQAQNAEKQAGGTPQPQPAAAGVSQ